MNNPEAYPKQEELPFEACEGVFDEQLHLAAAEAAVAPEALTHIIKRDGRRVPFDKQKIARAISRAAAATGEEDFDRAESLASGVALYLAKRLQGAVPTVEQVNDAVERVLIELGHGPAALAFARFRDRRARIRAFRQGNLQSLLHEFAEARDVAEESVDDPVFVRTSDDALLQWDRERIVAALRRETGLAPDQAAVIAHEVEAQIRSAGVKTLTAPLVRELVDAKLVEHGLEDARRRHARLGVPMFDAEQTICVPNRDESPWTRDPLATDLALAERVKREFALTQVFSQPHADAHRKGEWHLCSLGQIDRLESVSASLQYALRHGMPAPGRRRTHPPRTPESVVTHAGRFAQELGAHVAREMAWEDVPEDLLTAAEEAPAEALQAWVRMVAMALAPPPLPGGLGRPQAVLDVGKGSLAEGLLDMCMASGQEGPGGLAAKVRIAPEGPRNGSERQLLKRAAGMAARLTGNVVFEAEGQKPREEEAGNLRGAVAGSAVLNLPRAAYEAGSVDRLLNAHLPRLIERCVLALGERRLFHEKLLRVGPFGPWGFLAPSHGQPGLLDLDSCELHIGLTGLDACVAYLCGQPLHGSEEAFELGCSIVRSVADLSQEQGNLLGMCVRAAAEEDLRVAQRFVAMDLRTHQEAARKVLHTNEVTQELSYTPGIALSAEAPLNPLERVRMEGKLGEPLARHTMVLPLPGDAMGAESLELFLKKAMATAGCRRLRFRKAFGRTPAGG